MCEKNTMYISTVITNGILPLVKVIAEERPDLSKSFKSKNITVQIAYTTTEQNLCGLYYQIDKGQWEVVKKITKTPDIQLLFSSPQHYNDFFTGKSKKLPKIKGFTRLPNLIGTFRILLTMASLLQLKEPPKDIKQQELMAKCYFYLLSSGISNLNKVHHPNIHPFVKQSPDRVYAWIIEGRPDLSAYIRLKAGKSKACRGLYKRSKPFFAMRFDSAESALGILLETGDMIDYVVKSKLVMDGAPEFGGILGDMMKVVGNLVK